MRVKKILTFVLLMFVSVSGILFGCGDKYKDMKITSNRDEAGLQLYIGEDSDMEGGNKPSIGTITFEVEGAGEGVSTALLYNYNHDIVKITSKSVEGNKTTVTLQALSGGSTSFVAYTEEGGKTDAVLVKCIKRATAMSFDENYSPAIFNRRGSSLALNSKHLIFEPQDTTQNQVTYSLKNQVNGIAITPSGILSIQDVVSVQEVIVVATNTENQELFDEIAVHVINAIEEDDINIITSSQVYNNGKFTLSTVGEESSISFFVDVINSGNEDIYLTADLVENDSSTSNASNCVTLEQETFEFQMYANTIGTCKLELKVHFSAYDDLPEIKKEFDIQVIQLPKSISVNGITEDFDDDIYTYYQNGLGQPYQIYVGDILAYNKQFVLATESTDAFSVLKSNGNPIRVATLNGDVLSQDYDVLSSGQTIYVTGKLANQTAKLYIYAYGSFGHKDVTVRVLNLTTLLGATRIHPVYNKLDGEDNRTYYVEVGKSIEIGYDIDQNASAKGVRVVGADGREIEDIISTHVGDGITPKITVTGISSGTLTCKFILENFVESVEFDICAFTPINFDDVDAERGGIYLKVGSPLEYGNIAQADYANGTLSAFVLSLGTGTQLQYTTNPTSATIYDVNYSTIILKSNNPSALNGEEYANVDRYGYVYAKKVLPSTFEEAEEVISQSLFVQVEITSFKTEDDGTISTIKATRLVSLEVYVPLTNATLSKTSSTIYWADKLNVIQYENKIYQDDVSINLYPSLINQDRVIVKWDISSDLSLNEETINKSANVRAIKAPNSVTGNRTYTLTATIQYYSTIIVRRCVFTVVNPIKATDIIAYVDDIDSSLAYFDASSGIENCEAIQIYADVYSSTNEQNVTFNKVYYELSDENNDIVSVDENGLITPLLSGTAEIRVFAEDMIGADRRPTQFKTIKVVVADGTSNATALRIRTEDEFLSIKNEYFYYLANDVRLTKDIAWLDESENETTFYSFNGKIDGKGYYLQNLSLNKNKALFNELTDDARIVNLNINTYFDITTTEDIVIAGLALKNSGRVDNVNVYYSTAKVTAKAGDISISVAGLVGENNGVIQYSSVDAPFKIIGNVALNELFVGGLVVKNNNRIYGDNRNYVSYSQVSVYGFNSSGKIEIDENLTAINSAIGGISAINSTEADISGNATDLEITAKSIDNVGGIVGKNYGHIYDCLVYAKIVAKDNVGGIAGIQEYVQSRSPMIYSSAVELYDDIIGDDYGKVVGQNNVGGLVGYSRGYTETIVDEFNPEYEEIRTNYSKLEGSFVKSYSSNSMIFGSQNVGGLVGYASICEIKRCYVNANCTLAGFIGYAENTAVSKSYVLGSQATKVFGAVGEGDDVSVEQFYSTIQDDLNYVNATDCYYNDLKNIETFENWKITDELPDSGNIDYDWCITSSLNDGYPVVIYNDRVTEKTTASRIDISPMQDIEIVGDWVILYTNTQYKLSQVLSLSTDSSSASTIYVYVEEGDDGILSVSNTKNRYDSKTKIYSANSGFVTLKFILGSNKAITNSVKILFIDKIYALNIDNIKIKKGESAQIVASVSRQENIYDKDSYEYNFASNYVLGISAVDLDEKVEIVGTEQVDDMLLFSNYSVLKAKDSISKILNVKLFCKIMNGDESVYIQMAECNNFKVEIYSGATNIKISNADIDMTLIDDVTFTITLSTDKIDDVLMLELNSNEIYVDLSNAFDQGEHQYAKLSDDSVMADKNDAKLILSVIECSYDDDFDELVITFDLKFADKYLDANSKNIFNQLFMSHIDFYAESNDNIQSHLDITATPQRLLRIDLTSYSAGEVEGNVYHSSSKLSNTLTPGQQGMIVVDIYPEFAQYDEIEIASGEDNAGNKINFVQVAKYVSNIQEEKYLDIRPGSILTETGILLQKISNYHENGTTSFDGKFYLKILMNSNVDYDQIIPITATGTTTIYDEDGSVLTTRTVTKSINILVNQAPSLKLKYSGADYKGFVVTGVTGTDENKNPIIEEMNLVTYDQELSFGISSIKLDLQDMQVYFDIEKDANSDKQFDRSWIKLNPIVDNKFSFSVNSSCPTGTILKVSVAGKKIINDFSESIESEEIRFMVVDNIIKNTIINKGTTVFIVDVLHEMEVSVKTINGNNIEELESRLKKDSSYWFGIDKTAEDGWSNWNVTDNSKNFDAYTVYKTGETSFGIVPKKQNSKENKFKLSFGYYYNINGELTLKEENDGIYIWKTEENVVTMDIQIDTSIDKPILVSTIDEFYNMLEGVDYLLANDLYFIGSDIDNEQFENFIEGVRSSSADVPPKEAFTRDAYAPFALRVASFDGNTHKIHIYGNYNLNDNSNLGLFTQIASDTIVLNLDVEYNPEFDTTNKNAINFDGENNTLQTSDIYFGGFAAHNYGIISNCNVYYNGDITITLKDNSSTVNMAGFVSQNTGKITYSSVFGPDWSNNFVATNDGVTYTNTEFNTKFETANSGLMSGFVNANSNIISNCQVEFLGLKNTSAPALNAKVAGFIATNSSNGKIINSSVAGQRLQQNNELYGVDFAEKGITTEQPIKNNDARIAKILGNKGNSSAIYFARLESNANIAGFVYANSGSIIDSYSAIPLDSESRTAGFVYDNSNGGIVKTSYTVSIYDGTTLNSTAHAPFLGTNELGEVLNDIESSDVEYCYYLVETGEVIEEDVVFAEPATRISIELDDEGFVSLDIKKSFVAFDFGEAESDVWSSIGGKNSYSLPTLNANEHNQEIRDGFKRNYVRDTDESGITTIYFERIQSDAPYTIANAEQFINIFTKQAKTNDISNVLAKDIRLIDDIDLGDDAGTDALNAIKSVIYIGDFDGNGMSINGIKIMGSTVETNKSIYSLTTNSFGFFSQIGTATDLTKVTTGNKTTYTAKLDFEPDEKTSIRNLKLNIKEMASSNSAFVGMLAGIIVNTDIKSLTVNAPDVVVSGYNAVGGLAGAIIGDSTLYNVSVNASATSSFRDTNNNGYIGEQTDTYKYIKYSELNNNNGDPNVVFEGLELGDVQTNGLIVDNTIISKLTGDIETYLASYKSSTLNYGYAGGIAGIIDIYDSSAILKEDENNFEYDRNSVEKLLMSRSNNINVIRVSGGISVSGEIVGGIAGTISQDAFVMNAQLVLSDNQTLNGRYVSGGLVGVNNGAAIYLSCVEVSSGEIQNYDKNLTNMLGEYLFRNENVNPFAIGGLVGIQRGGYIISSYNKANVVNTNAHYAGGVIGYLTGFKNADNNGYNKYVLLQEVYTTANVLAKDGYLQSGSGSLSVTNGTEPTYYIYEPNGFAGGIAGGYKQIEGGENFDQFNGVIGINAFHKPDSYDVSSEYEVVTFDQEGKVVFDAKKGKYTTTTVKYGDIASGYYGVKKLSTGDYEFKYFKPRVGGIFGEVQLQSNYTYKAKDEYNNLYTLFAYDNSTINANDCKNSNGEVIDYVAKDRDNRFNVNESIDFYNYGARNIPVYLNYEKYNEKHSKEFNESSDIKASNTYLVMRGQDLNGIKYSSMCQDEDGIYAKWEENWIFKSPIYPSIKPTDVSMYTDIETEKDLLNIRSGGKYRIIRDIYLTKPWKPKSLAYITLTSALRTGDVGINGSERYAIYNININEESSTNASVGFFSSLAHSQIKNINFVYGTTFDDRYSDKTYSGYVGFNSTNTSSYMIGLFAGDVTNSSTITDCNIYVQKVQQNDKYNIQIKNNDTNLNQYSGAVVGYLRNSVVTNINLCGVNLSQNPDNKTTIWNEDNRDVTINVNSTIQNADMYFGGIAGYAYLDADAGVGFDNTSHINFNVGKDTTNNSGNMYVGGAVGYAINNSVKQLNINSNVTLYGNHKNYVYLGGLVGMADSNITQSRYKGRLNLGYNDSDVSKYLYLGGAVGDTTSNIMDTITDVEASVKVLSQYAFIGGLAGHSSGNIQMSAALCENGIEIKNNSNVTGLFVGGLVGATKYYENKQVSGGQEKYIQDSYSKGKLILGATAVNYHVAGLLGRANDGESNISQSSFRVSNCVADVDIEIQNESPLNASGLVGDCVLKISNCVALGSISYYDYLFGGKAAGFTTYGDPINNETTLILEGENVSLTTLKMVGNGVYATIPVREKKSGNGNGIKYNYNVSGVMEKPQVVENKSYGYGKNIDYTTLASSRATFVNGILSNIGVDEYQAGSKIIPKTSLKDADITKSGVYYALSATNGDGERIDHELNLSGVSTVEANIIANNSSVATTVVPTSYIGTLKGNLAGIELFMNDLEDLEVNYPIEYNCGYIFNCITTGKIKGFNNNNNNDNYYKNNMSGFVFYNKTKEGIINACGSMTYIDAQNEKVGTAGMSCFNYGLIANSYATNMHRNITLKRNAGFVLFNYKTIDSCFASGSMLHTDEILGGDYRGSGFIFANDHDSKKSNCYVND